MKKVMGGMAALEPAGGGCAVQWYSGHGPGNGTEIPDGANVYGDTINDTITFTNLSYSEAKALVSKGGRWCCASCSTASWL